jgi:hypothetical protein
MRLTRRWAASPISEALMQFIPGCIIVDGASAGWAARQLEGQIKCRTLRLGRSIAFASIFPSFGKLRPWGEICAIPSTYCFIILFGHFAVGDSRAAGLNPLFMRGAPY